MRRTRRAPLKFVFFDTGDCLFAHGCQFGCIYLKRGRNSRVMKSGASFLPYLYSFAFVVYFWPKVGFRTGCVYLRLFNFSLVLVT